jgi:hypothetical protein
VISKMIVAAARPMPSEPISPCSACTIDCRRGRPGSRRGCRVGDFEHLLAVSIGMSTGFSTSRRT